MQALLSIPIKISKGMCVCMHVSCSCNAPLRISEGRITWLNNRNNILWIDKDIYVVVALSVVWKYYVWAVFCIPQLCTGTCISLWKIDTFRIISASKLARNCVTWQVYGLLNLSCSCWCIPAMVSFCVWCQACFSAKMKVTYHGTSWQCYLQCCVIVRLHQSEVIL